MKTQLNIFEMKTTSYATLLTVMLISLFLYGCESNTVTNPYTAELDKHWEFHAGYDSVLTHHYGVSISVNNGIISGTSEIIDNKARHTGTVSGTISGHSVSLGADFANNNYDYSFSGIKSGRFITGKLYFNGISEGLSDSFNVSLLPLDSAAFNFGGTPAPNQYVFNKVSSASIRAAAPLIFVHGMAATLNEWNMMISYLDAGFRARHDIYVYQYDWQDSILKNGRILKDSVTARGLVNPIIIGHSMGGLVSRGYIASGGQITKLVTLGTPHLGTELANMLYIIPAVDKPGPQDMKPSGGYIQSMLTNQYDLANRSKYYSIAGQMGGHYKKTYPWTWEWNEPYYKDIYYGVVCVGWRILIAYGANDGLVPVKSALFENGNTNLPFSSPQLYLDHMHLVTPDVAPAIFSFINAL